VARREGLCAVDNHLEDVICEAVCWDQMRTAPLAGGMSYQREGISDFKVLVIE